MKPEDYEKSIFLLSDGDAQDHATEADFRAWAADCAKRDSHIATVIDAEGAIVCMAPVAVARLIARLLDAPPEFGEDAPQTGQEGVSV